MQGKQFIIGNVRKTIGVTEMFVKTTGVKEMLGKQLT
jgi:hypothetical protein